MFDIKHIQQLVINKKRRLQKLRERQALSGLDTPAHILVEIEDLEAETKTLEDSLQSTKIIAFPEDLPHLIEIEPRSFSVSIQEWVDQQIVLTNYLADIYRCVDITLQAVWPVTLKQKSFAVENLIQGVGQTINIGFRVSGGTGVEFYPLQLRLRADDHPSQTTTLRIFAAEATQFSLKVKETESKPVIAKVEVKQFRQELRKLTDRQVEQLCDEEPFQDLFDVIVDPRMTPAERTSKIIDFCKRRQLFPDLHQALKDILGSVYSFSDR